MFDVVGKYNRAAVYAAAIDPETYAQILRMCNTEELRDSRICMMPDAHAAAHCTVGTSMTFTDRLNPAYVGDDIGCGMQLYRLSERTMDFAALDDVIRREIPSGPRIHEHRHPRMKEIPTKELYCAAHIRADVVGRSLGTLGGGNHFIEVDRGTDGTLYLVIHSGSRRLGRDVALYHNAQAYFLACGIDPHEAARKKMRPSEVRGPARMGDGFLSGAYLTEYLHDMRVAVAYALESRRAMGELILSRMGLHATDAFATIHNYVDGERRILRKGAVSAAKGERLLIPLNMKDGALLCRGKGEPAWNETAPHGAGRVIRRSDAKASITLDAYRAEMAGIFTTSVNESTIDESPMAYRRIDEIADAVAPTADIEDILTPLYNFKASRPDGAAPSDDTADGED